MQFKDSRRYKYIKLIDSNDLSQSWHALNKITNQDVFIKITNRQSDLDNKLIKNIFNTSFNYQKELSSNYFVTAKKSSIEDGLIFHEYPLLNNEHWKRLTPEHIIKSPKTTLLNICLILDYLHLIGLVHCDVKLSNFLININDDNFSLKLIDFDFLSKSGNKPEGKVFGSPDYIAPEIKNNYKVLIQSDNYSLGIALNKILKTYQNNNSLEVFHKAINKRNFHNFITSITNPSYDLRSNSLIDALYNNYIIDDDDYEKYNNKLFLLLLLKSFKKYKHCLKTSIIRNIINSINLLGIPDELISDLQFAYNQNKLNTIKIIKNIIHETQIAKYMEYWHIQINDDSLIKLFKRLGSIQNIICRDRSEAIKNIDKSITVGDEFLKKHKPLKAYLMYTNIISIIDKERYDKSIYYDIVLKTAELLQGQNRLKEAFVLYKELLSCDLHLNKDIVIEAIKISYLLGDYTFADEFLAKYNSNENEPLDLELELQIKRLKSWQLCVIGNISKSFKLIDDVIRLSHKNKFTHVLMHSYYTLGVLHWYQGKYNEALMNYKKSLDISTNNNIIIGSSSTVIGLMMINYESANYKEVLKLGRSAVNHLNERTDNYKLVDIYSYIAFSYASKGDFINAQKNLYKIISSQKHLLDKIALYKFFFCEGVIYNKICNFEKSDAAFKKAKLISSSIKSMNLMGKLYFNLAENNFYQGKYNACNSYISKSAKIFESIDDKASLSELKLLSLLNNYYQNSNYDLKKANKIIGDLIRTNSIFPAVQASFHVILASLNSDILSKKVIHQIRLLIKDSEIPLFKSLNLILNNRNENDLIFSLKLAYKLLQMVKSNYFSMIICDKIAQIYLEQSRLKLSSKFYKQALEHAKNIKHQLFKEKFKNKIKELNETSYYGTNVVNSLLGISKILKNFSNYEKAIIDVIKYAVDQTGAERGVLLKRNKSTNKLNVVGYVNCDDESLIDIIDFSSSIPEKVNYQNHPIIVENARKDTRTKFIKSIIYHNILSIICLPITSEDSDSYVLYLDHHTIPALFEKDDVTYVSSISNILGIMLSSLNKYKNINAINRELINKAKNSGGISEFISVNPVIKKLFANLPEISQSDAPILIIGESGTGKEIIARMVHQLSFRSKKPLITLNCSSFTSNLIESELFGIKKNFATGVDKSDGKISAADQGTLFFDELGDMPINVQTKLLRVIEYGEFSRVGSNKIIQVDVRYIYATNKDLIALIGENKFRKDLYYRISSIVIKIPPLRERPDDIIPLIDHFLKRYDKSLNHSSFSDDALKALHSYYWPGNVRELRNLIERLCIVHKDDNFKLSNLPPEILENLNQTNYESKQFENIEKNKIIKALIENKWNILKTSQVLQFPRTTLYRKIKKYNITKYD